ncbi:hypothetical protein TeGR_g13356, partial [Tetraparma gracilis]
MKDALSASCGSILCAYVGQPFDTVKVRLQASPSSVPATSWSTCRAMVAKEGVSALWKGVAPTATGMIFENVVAFGANAQLKRMFPSEHEPVYTGGERRPGQRTHLLVK